MGLIPFALTYGDGVCGAWSSLFFELAYEMVCVALIPFALTCGDGVWGVWLSLFFELTYEMGCWGWATPFFELAYEMVFGVMVCGVTPFCTQLWRWCVGGWSSLPFEITYGDGVCGLVIIPFELTYEMVCGSVITFF